MFRNQWFAAVGAGVLGVAISATAGAQTGGDSALVKAWKQAGAAKVAIHRSLQKLAGKVRS